jgi:hypothetical protein
MSRVTPLGGGSSQLFRACDRCHVAARDEPPPAGDLLVQVDALDEQQRQRLPGWVKQGVRK